MAYTRLTVSTASCSGRSPARIDAAIARSYLDRKYPAPLPLSEGS